MENRTFENFDVFFFQSFNFNKTVQRRLLARPYCEIISSDHATSWRIVTDALARGCEYSGDGFGIQSRNSIEWPSEMLACISLLDLQENVQSLHAELTSLSQEHPYIAFDTPATSCHLLAEDDGNAWLLYRFRCSLLPTHPNRAPLGEVLFEKDTANQTRADQGLLTLIHESQFARELLRQCTAHLQQVFQLKPIFAENGDRGFLSYGEKIVHTLLIHGPNFPPSDIDSILSCDGSELIAQPTIAADSKAHRARFGWSFSTLMRAPEQKNIEIWNTAATLAAYQSTWYANKKAGQLLRERTNLFFQNGSRLARIRALIDESDATTLRLGKRLTEFKAFRGSLPPQAAHCALKIEDNWKLNESLEKTLSSNSELVEIYNRKLDFINFDNQKTQERALIFLTLIQSLTLIEVFSNYAALTEIAAETSQGAVEKFSLLQTLGVSKLAFSYLAEYSIPGLILMLSALYLCYRIGVGTFKKIMKSGRFSRSKLLRRSKDDR